MKNPILLIVFLILVCQVTSALTAKTQNNSICSEKSTFTSTPANVQDSMALVALFNQCNGSNWTKKDNWLIGPLDTWQGVTVENGRVVTLNLSDQNNSVDLTGQLPNELSNLTLIRSIDLGWNNLDGPLPDSWSALVNLQHLWLPNNQFTGSLPDSWGSLVNLTDLNLIYNQLTSSLPASWSTLVNLNLLRLDENKLSGTLPVEWAALINLSFLGLANNQISGSLPTEWATLTNLVNLELFENKITGTLPESWANLVNLQRLDLGSNQLPGNQREGVTGSLPESWSAFTELVWLNLSGNQLIGIVPESWKALTKLTYLALNNNQISGLPTFSTLSNLEYLDVGMNLLDFGDIEPNIGIPKMNFNYDPQGLIGESDSIIRYTGDEFKISVEVGGTNNQYQWFKNTFIIPGETGSEYFIPSVSSNDAGNYYCKITNTVATKLTLKSRPITLQIGINPPVVNLDSLALVALYTQCNGVNWTKKDNWLTGRLSTWQGVTVENGRVVELDLGDPSVSVGLTGSIPPELSTLLEIRKINFGNNELTGNLPKNWSELSNLKILILSENKFSGELPIEWSSLNNLAYLNLENNQLSGTLPIEWASLVNLNYLHISHNKLTGTLPETWSSLNNLFRLGIGSNQITGTLPDSWSSLSNLHELILSGNKLSGVLPSSWSSLSSLTHLILFDNQFTGTLPDNWSYLVNLIELFLSDNQLSGSLPESWSKLVNLNQLHLSNNFLTGVFPDSWSTLINLYSLNLAFNKFSGSFPESWKNLVNLQDLMLHSNQLSDLPDLSSLSKLNTLYVDNNFLDFGDIEPYISIPKGLFTYSPQALIGKSEMIIKNIGAEFKISVEVGGKSNHYQWYKNGQIISGATGSEFIIPSVLLTDEGNYNCQITNAVATKLTLESYPITLQVKDDQLLVDAGPDQFVYERSLVSLDGSASADLNKKPLKYKWTAPSEIILSSFTDAKPTFVAPDVIEPESYTFSLVVNDGLRDSPTDNVTVTIMDMIRVYPNITTGIVNIEFNAGTGHETEILVTNLNGLELLRKEILNPSLFQLDLSNLADETYIILIKYDTKHYSSKVILRKA